LQLELVSKRGDRLYQATGSKALGQAEEPQTPGHESGGRSVLASLLKVEDSVPEMIDFHAADLLGRTSYACSVALFE